MPEIVIGSVEHIRLLATLPPNATSFAEDVVFVEPPVVEDATTPTEAPSVVDTPYIEQVGNELTCTMGNWTGEPTSYAYEWFFDNTSAGEGNGDGTCTVDSGEVGQTATCVVTATNAVGSTVAPESNSVVVE